MLALTERSLVLLADISAQVRESDRVGLALLSRWWDHAIDENDQLVLPLRGGPAVFTARAAEARARLHDNLLAILTIGQSDGSIRADASLNDIIYFGTMLATPFHGSADQRRIARRQKEIHLDGLAARPRPDGGN